MTTYDNIKFTKGTDIVYLATSKIEENYTNPVKVFTYPTTEDSPVISAVLNLNKLEDRFTLTGHLSYGKLNASETKTSAKDKKDLLKVMVAKGSVVVMNYENTDYNVTVDKYQITDKASDNSDSVDEEIVYDVTITCVVSSDLI